MVSKAVSTGYEAYTAEAWNEAFTMIREKFTEFNDLFQEPDPSSQKKERKVLTRETLQAMYTIVERETKRLVELTKTATEMEQKLTKQNCCYSLCTITVLNVFSKVIQIGGSALSLYHISDVDSAALTALGITTGVSIFEVIGEVLINKSQMDDSESRLQLANINRQGVKHAKLFKKFLKQLKKIDEIRPLSLKPSPTTTPPTPRSETVIHFLSPEKIKRERTADDEEVDKRITLCFKYFEELPSNFDRKEKTPTITVFKQKDLEELGLIEDLPPEAEATDGIYCRREVTYSRIATYLVEKLPESDPLRNTLKGFDTHPVLERIASDAQAPLNVHYLPPMLERQAGWMDAEELAIITNPMTQTSGFHRTSPGTELQPPIEDYKNKFAQRFHQRRLLPFVETLKGLQLGDEYGHVKIKRTNSKLEEHKFNPDERQSSYVSYVGYTPPGESAEGDGSV